MSYDPGRCFWCENMQCDNCNGINEWNNPHASDSIGQPCKCTGNHPYKLRPQNSTRTRTHTRTHEQQTLVDIVYSYIIPKG
jgi:hypothetical protein